MTSNPNAISQLLNSDGWKEVLRIIERRKTELLNGKVENLTIAFLQYRALEDMRLELENELLQSLNNIMPNPDDSGGK